MQLPVMPPIQPMLAKLARSIPTADGLLYEPKWDGFRCIVFRDGDEIELASRNQTPVQPLLPRADPAAARRAPRPLRGRRRDRRRRRRRPRARLRRLAAAHPSGRVAGEDAGRADAGFVRRLRPAGARRHRPDGHTVRRAAGRCSNDACAATTASTSRPPPPTRRSPSAGSPASRAPGSTA